MLDDGRVTEDEVVDRIRQLISDGEYHDTRYIQIGPRLEPPRRRADGTVDRVSARRYLRHRPPSWWLERGSAEYTAARDGGLLVPLPPLLLATPKAVAQAERIIGYPLPRLLRRLYLEAGNGGFGPRSGILGVGGDVSHGDSEDLAQLHQESISDPGSPWPPWLIGIFDWGCAIWSLVDCRDPAGPMWSWDGNTHMLREYDQSICDWLALWLECRLDLPEGTGPPGHRSRGGAEIKTAIHVPLWN